MIPAEAREYYRTRTDHQPSPTAPPASDVSPEQVNAPPGPAPELSGTGRVMCMAEANGMFYAACGIQSEAPLSGGLFRRVDGEKPQWELLWRWPHQIRAQGDETEIMRGLTAIPDPKDGAHQVLLGTCNYPGVGYRIDPNRIQEITTELDIRAYFAKVFGGSTLRGPCLSAYNNFLPVTDPDTGRKVHLLGLWINHPGGRATDLGGSAWYLIRHADGSYGHGRVFDPSHAHPNPLRGLLATRTSEFSPFPEGKGRVLYFGGYDCANIESHNTAWIYKGTLAAGADGKTKQLNQTHLLHHFTARLRLHGSGGANLHVAGEVLPATRLQR